MKKIFVLLVALTATLGLWADSVITYTSKNNEKITLPGGVGWEVSVKSHTFTDGVGEIVFDGDLRVIPSYAFVDVDQLQTIVIPEGIGIILQDAFSRTSLTEVTFPSTLSWIWEGAFSQCKLESLVLPDSVKRLDDYAFAGNTSLTAIRCEAMTPPTCGKGCFDNVNKSIPVNVPAKPMAKYKAADGWKEFTNFCTDIPEPTSSNTITYKAEEKLTEVVDPAAKGFHIDAFNAGVIDHTFAEGEGTIYFSEDVTDIGWAAFEFCSGLTEITLPDVLTNIGAYAFSDCRFLRQITIPASVTQVDNSAFYRCFALTSITCEAVTPPACGVSAFYGVEKTIPVYVPEEAVEDYKAADEWKDFTNIRSIGDEETEFNTITYWAEEQLPEANPEEGIYGLNVNAFNANIVSHTFEEGIGTIVFDDDVTTIGEEAFYLCETLTAITLPASLTSIERYAFISCSSLESITIPAAVTNIGLYAFGACAALTSIEVEEGNTKYDSREDCNAIIETALDRLIVGCQTTIIPENVKSIGEGAFSGCAELTAITIPEGVTSILDAAFSYCSSLTAITIPASVTSIGIYVFDGCAALTSIKVAEGNTKYDSRKDCNAIIVTATNKLIAGCQNTVIPNTVTIIGNSAFDSRVTLTEITIPESVTTIEDFAFNGCDALTSITLPAAVTTIGAAAFSGCTDLTSITCKAVTPPACGEDCFWDVDKTIPLRVPAESISAYEAANEWKDFTDIRAISEEEGFINVNANANVNKRLMGGQLIIERAGKRYNLQGAELK